MAGWKEAIAELLYPWPLHCICCGEQTAERDVLCADCRKKLRDGKAKVDFAPGAVFARSAAAHPYAGPAGALVRILKYRSASALAPEMGEEMRAAAAQAGFPVPDAVTYVPMYWTRRMQKYFNQSELLAGSAAAEYGLKPEKLLRRVRPSRQQAALNSDAARERNVRGAFRATRALDGQRVLLVDDVYTTGATAKECARALQAAGVSEVLLLVYAKAARRR